MRTQLNPQVVDLVFALLEQERGAADAIATLLDVAGVFSRYSHWLSTADRIRLAERARDVADTIEHRREHVDAH